MTTYCLPLALSLYVIGVAWPLTGSLPVHSSRPVSTSTAWSDASTVPATKINPPAVTIGPPSISDPGGTVVCTPPKVLIEPSGTCQRRRPLARSRAVSVPQGGGLHGRCDGDCRKRRNIP